MTEAWQLTAAVAAGLAFVTWYAWIRMREAAEEWISAWHYWQSRKVETRATYDWWRRVVVALGVATAIAISITAYVYANRATVVPTTAVTDAGGPPEASHSMWL